MKLFSCAIFSLLSLSAGAAITTDIFEGSGSILGKTSRIFGTQCVVEFSNDNILLDERIHNNVTVFKITDKNFLKKLKSELPEVVSQVKKDNYGNEFLTFFRYQDENIESWPHLNQYSLTAGSLAVLDGNGMLRITFTLEKIANDEFKIKTFYVIQGRSTFLECKI